MTTAIRYGTDLTTDQVLEKLGGEATVQGRTYAALFTHEFLSTKQLIRRMGDDPSVRKTLTQTSATLKNLRDKGLILSERATGKHTHGIALKHKKLEHPALIPHVSPFPRKFPPAKRGAVEKMAPNDTITATVEKLGGAKSRKAQVYLVIAKQKGWLGVREIAKLLMIEWTDTRGIHAVRNALTQLGQAGVAEWRLAKVDRTMAKEWRVLAADRVSHKATSVDGRLERLPGRTRRVYGALVQSSYRSIEDLVERLGLSATKSSRSRVRIMLRDLDAAGLVTKRPLPRKFGRSQEFEYARLKEPRRYPATGAETTAALVRAPGPKLNGSQAPDGPHDILEAVMALQHSLRRAIDDTESLQTMIRDELAKDSEVAELREQLRALKANFAALNV